MFLVLQFFFGGRYVFLFFSSILKLQQIWYSWDWEQFSMLFPAQYWREMYKIIYNSLRHITIYDPRRMARGIKKEIGIASRNRRLISQEIKFKRKIII